MNHLLFVSTLLGLFSAALSAEEVAVTIKTLAAQMKYDTPVFVVPPGAKVKLTFINDDEMPHNLVLSKPAADKGFSLAQKAWDLGAKGIEKQWIPDDPRVLAATKMVPPHAQEVLSFDAPKELGTYPYICTFPGHALAMNGLMQVVAEGPKLTDGKFQLFLGKWTQLPDFSKLKPAREGALDDNLIQLKFDDYKNEYGIRFTGKLEVKTEGEYSFRVSSDDGARLSIDGNVIVNNDGSHPPGDGVIGRYGFKPGQHQFQLDYFQGDGGAAIYVSWEGPGFSETWLSKDQIGTVAMHQRRDDDHGIPLVVKDEAIIYRNFIRGVNMRGIGVGYPGGVNAAYDADLCNVGMIWRGGFMDAKRHWSDRGDGIQPPLGYAVVELDKNVLLAVLPSADTPWPPQPQDIPNGDWPAGFRFTGYTLDKKEIPTFFSTCDGVKVEDHMEAGPAPGQPGQKGASLQRVITLRSDKAVEGLHLRLASGEKIAAGKDGVFPLGEGIQLKVQGAILRKSNNNPELLVPVNFKEGVARIEVSYLWSY